MQTQRFQHIFKIWAELSSTTQAVLQIIYDTTQWTIYMYMYWTLDAMNGSDVV